MPAQYVHFPRQIYCARVKSGQDVIQCIEMQNVTKSNISGTVKCRPETQS